MASKQARKAVESAFALPAPPARSAVPEAEAQRFERGHPPAGRIGRLSIRVHEDTLWGIGDRARAARKSVKRFVLEALRAAGAKIADVDLQSPSGTRAPPSTERRPPAGTPRARSTKRRATSTPRRAPTRRRA